MPQLQSPKEHIELDPEGRPMIGATGIKVIEVALDHLAHGWSAEEIHFQHFENLGMAQIHAALAYYFDNQAAMDQEIGEQAAEIERRRSEQGDTPFRLRLRERRVL